MENNAYTQLIEYLTKDEIIECVQFGKYGWDGYNEPEPPIIPTDIIGKILPIEQSIPYLKQFSFYGGYGSPKCYAVRIHTNKRIIWVTQYDGSTELDSTLLVPDESVIPDMPGS